jgi:hypothetical protein
MVATQIEPVPQGLVPLYAHSHNGQNVQFDAWQTIADKLGGCVARNAANSIAARLLVPAAVAIANNWRVIEGIAFATACLLG